MYYDPFPYIYRYGFSLIIVYVLQFQIRNCFLSNNPVMI